MSRYQPRADTRRALHTTCKPLLAVERFNDWRDRRVTGSRGRSDWLERPPVDVFLGSHGFWYGLAEKHAQLQNRSPGDPNPFVDRAGYLAHVEMQEQNFLQMLADQQTGSR